MKDSLISLALTIALVALFSFVDCPIESTRESGSGTQFKGDSGLIIPGDGDLLADTIIEPESTPELPEDQTAETEATEVTKDIHTEIIKEEQNKMDGMLIAFWHGVAAVLIGETIALMVAMAWVKIHKHFPNGNANKN